MNSSQKNDKVSNYLYTYKDKLINNNKLGLFDGTKYFENFALNICNIYFDQEFRNLNNEKSNFPDIDLISSNNEIAIQVTTQKEMNKKIAKTINNFKTNQYRDNIKELYFFVLENYTTNNIKEFENEYFKVENIIDIEKIIEKTSSDNLFLNKMYELINEDEKGYDIIQNKYKYEVITSKNEIDEINSTIDNYEINRTPIINTIFKDNCKNIIIQGEAGIGKSALCKKIVENEKNILFIRAEKIYEVSNISDFWDFDIIKVLKYLNNTRLIIFIDSLELISDLKIKSENLKKLYEITKEYSNVKIIASCRSNEINSFLKIIRNYNIKTYKVDQISEIEQIDIINRFPFLKEYYKSKNYNNLIRIPFYINQLVILNNSKEKITENNFRRQIWKKIINNDNKRKEVIINIALERVTKHLYGVCKDDYDSKIINSLISEEILINNNDYVRFKYDIFEDICFDEYINKLYIESRKNLKIFFQNLKKIGRSWYRRYQIWIENKLLANNDIKILKDIILNDFDDEIRNQTIIGIIKSNYCESFFDEMGEIFNNEEYLNLFIDITNKNGFQIDNEYYKDKYINSKPTGNARRHLVKFILKQSKEYLIINENQIISIIYYLTEKEILENDLYKNIDKVLNIYFGKYFLNKDLKINVILNIYYKFANVYKTEISNMFLQLMEKYKNDKKYKNFCKDIINLTIENSNLNLLKKLGQDLTSLIEEFWCSNVTNNNNTYYEYEKYQLYEFGLNENIDYFYNKSMELNKFFRNLFFTNKNTIVWGISFINKLINNYLNNSKNVLVKYELHFVEEQIDRTYYGNEDFWINGEINYIIPRILTIISDELIAAINFHLKYYNDIELAIKYRNEVYNKANNILLLRTVLEIGKENIEKLPGYAIDICTNINFIYYDITLMTKNLGLKRRQITELRDYMLNTQIYCKIKKIDTILKKSENIIEYLTSKYKDKNDAFEFQIQNIDLRRLKIENNEGQQFYEIELDGNGKKYYENYLAYDKKENVMEPLIKQYVELKAKQQLDLNLAYKIIELGKIDKYSPIYFDKVIDCIIDLLNSNLIDNDQKDQLILLWINCLNEIKNNKLYFYDFKKTCNLFDQIYKNSNERIIADIKILMFDFLDPKIRYSVGDEVTKEIKKYIKLHEDLLYSFFYTYLALSKNEMSIQKRLFVYYKDFGENFKPHGQPKLYLSDELIKKLNIEINDKKIVDIYLIKKEIIDLTDFDINDFEIKNLIQGLSLGCQIKNDKIDNIIIITFKKVIGILQRQKDIFSHDKIIDLEEKYELGYIYNYCLYNKTIYKELIDIYINDEIIYNNNLYELYNRSFSNNLVYYFDGYKNANKLRTKCKNIINYLEEKVDNLKNKEIKLYDYILMIPESERELGDWSKLKTEYSLLDIQFIGEKIAKYGKYNFNGVLKVLNRMQINHLMPNILKYLSDLIDEIKNSNKIIEIEYIRIVKEIIESALIDYRQEILEDEELTNSYENILEFLVNKSFINAQLILDEFRTH